MTGSHLIDAQMLLRSTFKAAKNDDPDLLSDNAWAMQLSLYEFDTEALQKAWEYIHKFVTHHGHVPQVETVVAYFKEVSRDQDVVNMLEVVKTREPLYRGDFRNRLERAVERRQMAELERLLTTCNVINRQGLTVKDDRKRERTLVGPSDAASYFGERVSDILRSVDGSLKEGPLLRTSADVLTKYEEEKNKTTTGVLTGYRQIDTRINHRGKEVTVAFEPGELWVHMAHTSHLKSTFLFNIAYNLAIYYRQSTCLFELEMTHEQCQRVFFAMHSMHSKFTEARIALGIQKDPKEPASLSYSYLKAASLTEEGEQLMKLVAEDLQDVSNGYGEVHFRGYGVTDDRTTMKDIQRRAEQLFTQEHFDVLMIDYGMLVDPQRRYGSRSEEANAVMRDAKKLALNFRKGQKIPVLCAMQTSREGVKYADANNGLYRTYHLNYANEGEKSADRLTSSYLNDDLRARKRALFAQQKGRNDQMFDPFYMAVHWANRRLINCLERPEFLGNITELDYEAKIVDKAEKRQILLEL